MKRLLLYVHFNKYNDLSSHVEYQLTQMRPLFSKLVFISNSQLPDEKRASLLERGLMTDFIQRENSGFDFAAWRDGMSFIGFEELKSYDSVTLMNDTCFGPFWDFESTFDAFSGKKQVDFWGITNNRAHTVKPENSHSVLLPDHIQSYFVTFKHQVITDSAFKNFFGIVEQLDDVVQVIIRYETAMTKHFEDAGFKSDVLFDTREMPWQNSRHRRPPEPGRRR